MFERNVNTTCRLSIQLSHYARSPSRSVVIFNCEQCIVLTPIVKVGTEVMDPPSSTYGTPPMGHQ